MPDLGHDDPITVFVSYAHRDRALVEEIVTAIEPLACEQGMEIWYDDALTGGDDFTEEIERKLMRLSSFNKSTRRLQRLMVGYASELEVDGHGRVLIPRELREFAGLERQAMLIGQGNKFELWDEARWNERRDSWLTDETGDGLGLPAELESLSL